MRAGQVKEWSCRTGMQCRKENGDGLGIPE